MWNTTPGYLAAAHRDRHHQRGVSQLGVVALAEGEAEDPAGSSVQHRYQMEFALTGSDFGAIAEPLTVELTGAEVAFDQVRRPPAALP